MDRGTGNFPDFLAAAKGGREEEWTATVSMAVKDAIRYVEEELAPERVRATEYYHGMPLGNEMEGRSSAQMTEVRDGIVGQLPGLIRLIHGPEHTVEYLPKRADAVAMAEQATDYARFIFEEDNNGLLITHAVLKDGLLKKIGVLKWGMDETQEVRTTKYVGLTREDLLQLASDEANTLSPVAQSGPDAFDVEVSRTEPVGRIWVKEIPPDDFFWNREARSLNDAILVGHRDRITKGDLLAMGVTEAMLDEYAGRSVEGEVTQEEQARREVGGTAWNPDPDMGDLNRRYVYCEVYMRLDMGRGVELRRICTLGDQFIPIKNEPVASVPFAVFSPDPEPHAFLGGSWYDRLKDIQRINSALLRGFLDTLAISLFPRPIYVDGQASVADIMNTAIGAPVRERMPNMVRFDVAPFQGDKVLPALSMMREVVERRVGQKDGAQSLDMDALQSTGKEAVNAAIVASQSVSELIARFYAEQVLKPLFRGLLPLMAHPASKPRLLRLRGQYVEVDPLAFDADMDVSVSVALGAMNTDKKVATLDAVIQDQSAILAELGPDNPIVTLPMLRNAKAKRLMLSGVKDVTNYYKELPDDWQPPPPPPPQPSEDELWRQAEAKMAFEKTMKELAIKQDELALKAKMHEDEQAAKEAELAVKREAAHNGPHNADIERYKVDKEIQFKYDELAAKMEMERYKADRAAEAAKEAAKAAPHAGEAA